MSDSQFYVHLYQVLCLSKFIYYLLFIRLNSQILYIRQSVKHELVKNLYVSIKFLFKNYVSNISMYMDKSIIASAIFSIYEIGFIGSAYYIIYHFILYNQQLIYALIISILFSMLKFNYCSQTMSIIITDMI